MNEYSIGGQERGGAQASEGIADIPQNRTLIVEQLTKDAPVKPEITYDLKTVGEVFDHFQPKCEVEFQDAEGSPVTENIQFQNLSDFGKKGIINQSKFLQDLNDEELNYQHFMKVLKSNKILQKLIADPTAKEIYLAAIQTLINELEDATKDNE